MVSQQQIHDWAESTFGPADPESPRLSLRVFEECIELCLADGASVNDLFHSIAGEARKAGLNPGDDWTERRPQPDRVPGEAGDVQITLWRLAGSKGFDINAEAAAKHSVNLGRRWRRTGGGCGQHIKGGA